MDVRYGPSSRSDQRLAPDIDGGRLAGGLARLVLSLVRFLHELLELQAIRRMDSGNLTDEEIEDLGLALKGQAEEIEKLRHLFGLSEKDLDLDLGPLGRLA